MRNLAPLHLSLVIGFLWCAACQRQIMAALMRGGDGGSDRWLEASVTADLWTLGAIGAAGLFLWSLALIAARRANGRP